MSNEHGSAESLRLLGASKVKYPTHPDEAELEKIPWNGCDNTVVWLNCPEYTCSCPKTGQPDFATIKIQYVPNKWLVESKALKLYLFSFRNYGHFHEVGINRIANDIYRSIQPRWIRVVGDFYPRGGISIVPVTELGNKEYSAPMPSIKHGP